MYLTKYILNKSDPKTRKAIIDRQNLHALIQKAFMTDRKSNNVLYRINGNALYVSSDQEPAILEGLEKIGSREITTEGNKHRFSIITIPHKCINDKKLCLKSEEERLDWLNRKAEQNGFRIINVREAGRENISSSKKKFSVTAYKYDGVLIITDFDKFEKARREGIGPMKAYGCGMLVVA